MKKFDNDEQQISDLFSQIDVDSSKLTKQVKSRLHEEKRNIPAKNYRRWASPAIVAIMMCVVLAAGTTAAALGSFDWFIERFNPSFGEIVEQVEVQSEDQGIKMEVIGAQKYDNRAIVYLSLQDLTGQNRLTEQTDFRDGFSVKTSPHIADTVKGGGDVLVASMSWKQEMLFFNEDTNTIYYEFNITSDPNTPLQIPLELGSFLIYFDEKDYTDEPISVSLTASGDVETLPIEEEQIWGGSHLSDDRSSLTETLLPGNYAVMPHGEKDQWVSNIGMIDGKLHVQIGKTFNKKFGSTDAMLTLKDADGNLISNESSFLLLSDGKNNILDLEKNDYADAEYKYEEFIFPVNVEDLSKYTLHYTGSVFSGVEGNWKVAANVTDTTSNIHTWKNDRSVDGHLFEYITLSPLGVLVIGTYEGENMVSDMSVEVETVDDIISLTGGGGSHNTKRHTFNASWDTEEPLDVNRVTAIIVDGTRITVN